MPLIINMKAVKLPLENQMDSIFQRKKIFKLHGHVQCPFREAKVRSLWFFITVAIAGWYHCNPLQGKYRFFTGKSLCSISTLTYFGSVQGLEGQILLKYREIYAFLYRNQYFIFTFIIMFLLQGFPCSLKNNNMEFFKNRENPVNKTGKKCS